MLVQLPKSGMDSQLNQRKAQPAEMQVKLTVEKQEDMMSQDTADETEERMTEQWKTDEQD